MDEKKESRGGRRENSGRKPLVGARMVNFQLCGTPEFRRKLKDLAQNEKMSVSEFVRWLVTDYERRQNS